ncbi:hypothetical protein PSHT_13647 [Puccinia striiformis]|uniref:C2H2-type domain-containing protein n=1 Tax=Puccinia striiformis TaxID=27350 RepID=A0A2S4UPE6_9BASI|nr:hypothetical protein PSHT_13647 [Puccinia striiformis]
MNCSGQTRIVDAQVKHPFQKTIGLMIEAVVKSLFLAGHSMTDSWSSKEIWMQMRFKREAGSKLSALKSQTRVGGNEVHIWTSPQKPRIKNGYRRSVLGSLLTHILPDSNLTLLILGFIQHQTNKGELFECTACGPKLIHKRSVQHKKKVAGKEIKNDLSLGLEEVESSLLVRSEEPNFDVVDFEFEQSYSPRLPNSPNAIRDSLNKQFKVEEAIRLQNTEDNPDIPLNNQIPEFNWHEYVEYELERILEDSTLDDLLDEEVEEEETIPTEEDHKQWAPFRSKMDFVGCLLVGYTRNLLSRTLFDQIRLILNELCHLKIPAWSSIRRSQKRIRDLLGLEVKMQESVWGMPCAVLSSRHALQQCVIPTIRATSRASYQLRIPQNINELATDGFEVYDASISQPVVWKETINRTHELFKVATEDTMKEFETLTKEYGVKDWINKRFIEDRAIPLVKEKMDILRSENFARLFNPFLRLIAHFVLVNTARSGKYVAQVNSVWKSGASFFAHVTRLQRSKINDFYMMREFTKTSTTCLIKVKDIVATLNLQHNCHDGKCTIEKTKVTRVERQETNV